MSRTGDFKEKRDKQRRDSQVLALPSTKTTRSIFLKLADSVLLFSFFSLAYYLFFVSLVFSFFLNAFSSSRDTLILRLNRHSPPMCPFSTARPSLFPFSLSLSFFFLSFLFLFRCRPPFRLRLGRRITVIIIISAASSSASRRHVHQLSSPASLTAADSTLICSSSHERRTHLLLSFFSLLFFSRHTTRERTSHNSLPFGHLRRRR
jgi:hypothetical protein